MAGAPRKLREPYDRGAPGLAGLFDAGNNWPLQICSRTWASGERSTRWRPPSRESRAAGMRWDGIGRRRIVAILLDCSNLRSESSERVNSEHWASEPADNCRACSSGQPAGANLPPTHRQGLRQRPNETPARSWRLRWPQSTPKSRPIDGGKIETSRRARRLENPLFRLTPTVWPVNIGVVGAGSRPVPAFCVATSPRPAFIVHHSSFVVLPCARSRQRRRATRQSPGPWQWRAKPPTARRPGCWR